MANFPETRVSLILRLSHPEDVAAWQEFTELYAPSLYALALRRGLQAADAEDVTQDVLFGVARAIQRFDPHSDRAKFRTWLSSIARNLIADFFAGRAKRPVSEMISDSWLQKVCRDPLVEPQQDEVFDIEFRTAAFQLAAKRVQQRVTEASWQAFQRTVVAEEPTQQVADDLGMAVGNVYVVRCRVLKMLRTEVEALQAEYDEAPRDSLEINTESSA